MSNEPKAGEYAIEVSGEHVLAMSFELVVISVSSVERAKHFYTTLGWRLDLDFCSRDYRVIQFTPPGSACSIMFGKNITAAPAGSTQGLYLIVSDVEAARDELVRRGIEVGTVFHDAGGVFHHADGNGVVGAPNPRRQSYASYAAFSDPDGNGWLLQEITARLSPEIKRGDARFTSQLLDAIHSPPAV